MQLHTKQRLRDDKVKLIAINTDLKWQIEQLQNQLNSYNEPKNWTRSYDHKGDLINESALFIPKLTNGIKG